MTRSLRILCWNIDEGKGGLPQLAAHIRSKAPDIVLLNEVRRPSFFWKVFFSKPDQTELLARAAELPYYCFAGTNMTGLTGEKGVAVLSRYPLGPWRLLPVLRGSTKTSFGTLLTSVMIDGKAHQILSTRLAPHNGDGTNRQENPLGIQQSLSLVRTLDEGSPVIFGGDFNASTKPGTNEYEGDIVRFIASSGLKEAINEGLEAEQRPDDRVDYLFYRGDYKVSEAEFLSPEPQASDHPWIFTVLESTQAQAEPGLVAVA